MTYPRIIPPRAGGRPVRPRPVWRWLWVVVACGGLPSSRGAAPDAFAPEVFPVLRQYCLDCHGNVEAEAHTNIEQLLETPDVVSQFRIWEKIAAVVREGRMPPDDAEQPSASQRVELSDRIQHQLVTVAQTQAGDPGRVTLRRLTSAEYAYTIEELTGLQLDFAKTLVGDAVGGEGFTNVGDVQFVQDSTLQRYLEAARSVADRAVVGAGPLRFTADPGTTGWELWAIERIQQIYRQHGFRAAAGEGAEPFGLDRYSRAFFVAWQYLHRQALGLEHATLAQLAQAEGLHVRFVEHIWNALHAADPTFPTAEIITAWRGLAPPQFPGSHDRIEANARHECDNLLRLLRQWQRRLAQQGTNGEEAPLLAVHSIALSPTAAFQTGFGLPPDSTVGSFQIHVDSAASAPVDGAVVIWRNPRLGFRMGNRRRSDPVPLGSVLTQSSRQNWSHSPALTTEADGRDFVTRGATSVTVEFEIPRGATAVNLSVEAVLQTEAAQQPAIVRCTIVDGSSEGSTVADSGETSAILGAAEGPLFDEWKASVLQFARWFPDVSHSEPAPSDRDPIPAPYDNSYNNPERNEFHYKIKYHRADQFLVEQMLDDDTRTELDQAWTDLLSSFDYYNSYLSFIAGKSGVDLQGRSIQNLDPSWVEQLPGENREIVRQLETDYRAGQNRLQAAQAGHLDDLLRLAELAWRRPLSQPEQDALRSFYHHLGAKLGIEHAESLRALITRILVAPAFLFRLEPASDFGREVVPLSPWETASRLSYFLWSSPPDDELRQAAARGILGDDEELARQARRMLRSPKARRFAAEFFGQWFGFYRFGEYRGIDAQRFPEFDEQLRAAMLEEAIAFFEFIVREDRPAQEILEADYSFWNERLGRHYGMTADGLTRLTAQVAFTPDVGRWRRGGLLGLGAVQAVTSAPLRTSAVKRGDWVLRRILGTPVPPPPADAGSIPADDVLADGQTVRERLIAHRQNESCVNCHSRMDPLGFALENFDPIGRWRDAYRDGQPIDPSGTLRDGTEINGPEGLRHYLQQQRQLFYQTLSTKLLGYALGRGELLTDRPLIAQMSADLEQEGRISDLAVRVVTSPQFRTRRAASSRDVEPE